MHTMSPQNLLEVFMVNNLVFRWPKPLFFMVLGAHGSVMSFILAKDVATKKNVVDVFFGTLTSWR